MKYLKDFGYMSIIETITDVDNTFLSRRELTCNFAGLAGKLKKLEAVDMVTKEFKASRPKFPWGAGHYEFWKSHLVDKMNFPVVKVSDQTIFNNTLRRYPNATDLFQCTRRFTSSRARTQYLETTLKHD